MRMMISQQIDAVRPQWSFDIYLLGGYHSNKFSSTNARYCFRHVPTPPPRRRRAVAMHRPLFFVAALTPSPLSGGAPMPRSFPPTGCRSPSRQQHNGFQTSINSSRCSPQSLSDCYRGIHRGTAGHRHTGAAAPTGILSIGSNCNRDFHMDCASQRVHIATLRGSGGEESTPTPAASGRSTRA